VLPIVHMHNRVGLERMGKSPYGSGALLTLDDVLGKNGVLEGFERAQKRDSCGSSAVPRSAATTRRSKR